MDLEAHLINNKEHHLIIFFVYLECYKQNTSNNMINNVEVIKHQPMGLSKEQIIAEFENLASWERQEVLDELDYRTRGERRHLRNVDTDSLCRELERRGYSIC